MKKSLKILNSNYFLTRTYIINLGHGFVVSYPLSQMKKKNWSSSNGVVPNFFQRWILEKFKIFPYREIKKQNIICDSINDMIRFCSFNSLSNDTWIVVVSMTQLKKLPFKLRYPKFSYSDWCATINGLSKIMYSKQCIRK